ncbi:DUF4153 domain-containing protein [Micromonospora taraxaci]|uniref:Uncharacterized protein DUF4173 n=1 Tax=Micromonospora taraxaci TaxID=1316803 RepID=A0A561VTZ6_9ACTN|nr:DUF4173 domain-containing protein [Micromonospora taraxaci]TWG15086.1 uncharacterized protein DUF4173 [Micromonospora taraxaci]
MTSPGSVPVPAPGPTGAQVPPTVRPGPTAPPTAGQLQPWPPAPVLPRPPSFTERRWPGPSGAARPLVLAALTAATVVGASALTVVRPGLGWLVAALAGVTALGVAAVAAGTSTAVAGTNATSTAVATATGTTAPTVTASPTTPGPTSPPTAATTPEPTGPTTATTPSEPKSPATTSAVKPAASTAATAARPGATGAPGRAPQVAWAVATIALVAVGTVRAAGWLFALCLLAAVVTGTLALTGGRSPLGMLIAATLPPAATVRALPWAVRGLQGGRSRSSDAPIGRILTSLALSAGLLMLFGLLFSSADAVFADLVTGLLPDVSSVGVVDWLVRLLLIGGGLLGGAFLVSRPPDLEGLRPKQPRTAHRLEWTLPLGMLVALFSVFVLVQLTVLFGGAGHVLRTAGLTYAEYARGGFWQLLAVTALTLLVIAVAARRAPKATRADRLLVRVLLGALTALSLVIVASALYRMQVYADAYGATRLRLVVATIELWLGLLFVLVGVAVVRLRADWLPRLVIGTAVLALLGLALVNPDRLIAERNVDRYLQTGRLDVGYLSGLSADAVPALVRLPEPVRVCALGQIAAELPRDGVWETNLGRERARRMIETIPLIGSEAPCLELQRW